jgi:hypothetical protein
VFVARHPAAIVGRTGTLSFEAERELCLLRRCHRALENHLVLPVVPQVVGVAKSKPGFGLRQKRAQENSIPIDDLIFSVRSVLLPRAVRESIDFKHMHVAILPAHRRLDVHVEVL